MSTPKTTTHHTTIAPPFPGAPAFTFHLTRLSDTLFVWVGAAERLEDDVKRNIAQEWAVAMPSRGVRLPPICSAGLPQRADNRIFPPRLRPSSGRVLVTLRFPWLNDWVSV